MLRKLMSKLGVREDAGLWSFCWQFFKFCLVGLSNTAVSLAVYYLFIWISPGLYMWGNCVGFVLSVLNAFYWSNRFVFKSENNDVKSLLRRLGKSYLAYGSTFLLSTGLLFLQVELWDVAQWLAPLINLVVTIPLNFVINKLWTFGEKGADNQ